MNLRDRYRHMKGWAGVKVYGTAYNIDLQDTNCPVACPSCAIGSLGRRPRATMSMDMFKAILDKAQREGKVRNVQLYAYSEPTMVANLHEYLEELRRRKIPAIISTIAQTSKCEWAKVVEARPREIRISFPGWKHMAYYQRGAKPEVFDGKFAYLMTMPRHPETIWTLGFHIYKDTLEELPRAKALAERYGLKFVALPAMHMENSVTVRGTYPERDKELISRLLETPEEEAARYTYSDFCYCQSKQITISATGMTWLCQNTYNLGPLSPFLDTPLGDLRKRIREHPFCPECKAAKQNLTQTRYGYWFENGDPVERANKEKGQ
jgi:hypothetical protein